MQDQPLIDLLQRWREGNFTRADEETLLRLRAEGDDFTREAIDGYLSAPEHQHDERLRSIGLRLNQGARARPAAARFTLLMAMAASFALLIAGAIWWFSRPQPLAETAMIADSPERAPTMPAEQVQSPPVQPPAPSTAKMGKTRPAEGAASDVVAAAPASDDAAIVAIATETPATVNADIDAAEELVEVTQAEKEVLEKSEAVSFSRKRTDPPGAPPSESAKKDKEQMSRANAPAPSMAKPAAKKAASNIEPEIGWEALRQYLLQNTVKPEAARQANISGIVKVRLTIDMSGVPSRAEVIQSLGYGCDEEAQRVLSKTRWLVPVSHTSRQVVMEVSF